MAVCAGGASALIGCRRVEPPPVAEELPPVRTRLVVVERCKWPKVVRVQGSLMADESAVVGAKVAGRVKDTMGLNLGSVVRKGDVLATLDAEQLDLRAKEAEAQLEQARAKLGLKPTDKDEQLRPTLVPGVVQEEAVRNEARSSMVRAKSLLEKHAIAEEEAQEKEATYAVAEAKYRSALNAVDEQVALVGVRRAQLDLTRQILADAIIHAPFDGALQLRHVAPGVYLQEGQPVATLVRTDPLRFHGGVPEREAMAVQPRQAVEISVQGLTEPLRGEVTRISPALDMSNRSLVVEIDVPNPHSRLRVGLFAEASIVVDPDAQTLAVPALAVREFAGVEKVWTVREGIAKERVVQTGRRNAKHVEILRGLSAGDLVVANANDGRVGKVENTGK